SYELSGFKTNTSYTVLGFNKSNDVVSFGSVLVNASAEKDFTVQGSTPSILPVVVKNADGTIAIRFELTTALYKSSVDLDNDGTEDSSQPDKIITLVSGDGSLSFADDWLASDRKKATVTYTPTAQTPFVVRFTGTFNKIDSSTGNNFTVTNDFTFYPGLG